MRTFDETPEAAFAFANLARDLARGEAVPIERVLIIVAAAGKTTFELQLAADRFAIDRLADDGCPHSHPLGLHLGMPGQSLDCHAHNFRKHWTAGDA